MLINKYDRRKGVERKHTWRYYNEKTFMIDRLESFFIFITLSCVCFELAKHYLSPFSFFFHKPILSYQHASTRKHICIYVFIFSTFILRNAICYAHRFYTNSIILYIQWFLSFFSNFPFFFLPFSFCSFSFSAWHSFLLRIILFSSRDFFFLLCVTTKYTRGNFFTFYFFLRLLMSLAFPFSFFLFWKVTP